MSTIDGQGATATWFGSFQRLPAAKEIPTRLSPTFFFSLEERRGENKGEKGGSAEE